MSLENTITVKITIFQQNFYGQLHLYFANTVTSKIVQVKRIVSEDALQRSCSRDCYICKCRRQSITSRSSTKNRQYTFDKNASKCKQPCQFNIPTTNKFYCFNGKQQTSSRLFITV